MSYEMAHVFGNKVEEEELMEENKAREGKEQEGDDFTNLEGVYLSNKRMKEMPMDRLSALPDSLILHILHFLDHDVKEAAVTSVLSKRWQYLWGELPNLNFRNRSCEVEKVRDFVSWVHRTLLFRRGLHLAEFKVDFVYGECFASDVNAWVRFAVNSKVKELDLVLHSQTCFYTLPQVLYSSSSLARLCIQRCIVAPHRTIEWQSLTELYIEGVKLHEDIMQKILSGCPVLHRLIIISCWGFKRLDINSESIYELMLSDSGDTGDSKSEPLIEISAPYLQSLFIFMCPIGKKVKLTNIPSLVKADIHYSVVNKSVEVMDNTMEFLEKTQHAKDLIVGSAFIKVVSELVGHGWRLPQSRRGFLGLDSWRDEESIPGILGLLESSPNLDTLLIECAQCGDLYENCARTWGPVARDDMDCDLSHLKIIRFLDFADPNLAGEPMLTVARILLKRATSLEKMKIKALESLIEFPSEFAKMSEKVLSYPRSSEKAVVVLRP